MRTGRISRTRVRVLQAAALGTLLLGVAAGGSSAAETGWERSRGKFARYGLISHSCLKAGHSDVYLGFACRAGRIELVSAAGGGGPPEGPARLRFGQKTLELTFEQDPRALNILGIAASRAAVAPAGLSALAHASEVELRSGQGTSRLAYRFRIDHLSTELQRSIDRCVSQASPTR